MGQQITREEIIEGLRESYKSMCEYEKFKDASFVRYPDMETILDYIEEHGLPPK